MISIVILNWNGRELMEKFLPSVIENSPAEIAEVVVADNGSTDDSIRMLKEKFPSVRRISFDKNLGFAGGYNKAMEQIRAEYTVLLNSDVEVTPGWLTEPLALLESDSNIAAVQPKLIAQKNKAYFEYAGAAGGFMDKYGYPYCRGRILSVVEKDEGQYDTGIDIFWATGACMFVKTDVYKKEGGLDATFFAHQEEIDLCWRLRSRGYRIVYTPESVVYHVGGATLKVENPHKTFLNFRNNLLMIYKNISPKELDRVMFIRYWLDMSASLHFFISGHKKNASAILRARKEFKKLKKEYLNIREENISKTKVKDIPEILKRSILFSFYIRGKKKFSDQH
jgi:GT2 family glycosyltransferase